MCIILRTRGAPRQYFPSNLIGNNAARRREGPLPALVERRNPVSWTAVTARWTISLVIQYQGEVPPSRASDADREHVLELLRTAAVEGRLSHETFLLRMERVLTARDLAELRITIEDLPGAEVAPQPTTTASPGGLRGVLRRMTAAPTH